MDNAVEEAMIFLAVQIEEGLIEHELAVQMMIQMSDTAEHKLSDPEYLDKLAITTDLLKMDLMKAVKAKIINES